MPFNGRSWGVQHLNSPLAIETLARTYELAVITKTRRSNMRLCWPAAMNVSLTVSTRLLCMPSRRHTIVLECCIRLLGQERSRKSAIQLILELCGRCRAYRSLIRRRQEKDERTQRRRSPERQTNPCHVENRLIEPVDAQVCVRSANLSRPWCRTGQARDGWQPDRRSGRDDLRRGSLSYKPVGNGTSTSTWGIWQ